MVHFFGFFCNHLPKTAKHLYLPQMRGREQKIVSFVCLLLLWDLLKTSIEF